MTFGVVLRRQPFGAIIVLGTAGLHVDLLSHSIDTFPHLPNGTILHLLEMGIDTTMRGLSCSPQS